MKRQGLSKLFTTGVLATSLLASSSAAFANDMFLKIDGIKGESVDSKHKDAIDVMSWSWGTSTGTGRVRKGAQPAACVQDLHVTKFTDASTPGLIMNGVSGDVAQTAVLTVRKSGGDQQEFLRLTMRNVSVVSFQTGGSEGSQIPMDAVTLHFESMTGEYIKQKPDGSSGDTIKWDITGGNAACNR